MLKLIELPDGSYVNPETVEMIVPNNSYPGSGFKLKEECILRTLHTEGAVEMSADDLAYLLEHGEPRDVSF